MTLATTYLENWYTYFEPDMGNLVTTHVDYNNCKLLKYQLYEDINCSSTKKATDLNLYIKKD